MASITLQQGATTYTVGADRVTASNKRNIDAEPNANCDGPVEVQTMAYENMKFSVQGIHFTSEYTLTQSVLNSMLTTKYDGTNPLYLTVVYGDSDPLYGTTGLTTIPVVLESYTFNASTKDSKNAYMPIGTITLVETAATS